MLRDRGLRQPRDASALTFVRGALPPRLITREGRLILAPGGAEEREYVSEDRVVVLA